MKRLILICGPMGVGKTAAGRELQRLLPRCAFLDGDWCWDIRPFAVNDETRAMVLDNIRHLLAGYLGCGSVENVVLAWVMQEREIADALLSGLPLSGVDVRRFALIARPEALEARILADVARGIRSPDVLERSLAYLPKYGHIGAEQIDTSERSAPQVAQEMLRRLDASE